MPIPLPENLIFAKNQLDSKEPWLLLVEFTLNQKYTDMSWSLGSGYPVGTVVRNNRRVYESIVSHTGLGSNEPGIGAGWEACWVDISATYRLVQNNEDITYQGKTYTRFPVKMEPFVQEGTGQLPQMKLYLSNVQLILQGIVEYYNGGVGSFVKLTFVSHGNLDEDHTLLEKHFTVKSVSCDEKWIVLTISVPDPLLKNFPLNSFTPNHCRWGFRSVECAYSGSESVCEHTRKACKELNNEINFGAELGLQGELLRVV